MHKVIYLIAALALAGVVGSVYSGAEPTQLYLECKYSSARCSDSEYWTFSAVKQLYAVSYLLALVGAGALFGIARLLQILSRIEVSLRDSSKQI